MTAIAPERVCAAACQIIERRQTDSFSTVASAVYGHPDFAQLDDVLATIFESAHLERSPISQHAWSSEAGI
jgi:hypothetical protein